MSVSYFPSCMPYINGDITYMVHILRYFFITTKKFGLWTKLILKVKAQMEWDFLWVWLQATIPQMMLQYCRQCLKLYANN